MKKMILSLVVALSLGTAIPAIAAASSNPAPAQTEMSSKKSKKGKKSGKKNECRQECKKDSCKKANRAFKGIEMTDEQKSKVENLSAKQREEMDKMFKDLEAKRQKSEANYEKKLSEVLTPEQMVQYKENKAKMHDNIRKERPTERGAKACGKAKGKFSRDARYATDADAQGKVETAK